MNDRPAGGRQGDPLDELEQLFGRGSRSTLRTAKPEAETQGRHKLLDRFRSLGQQKTVGEVLDNLHQRYGRVAQGGSPAPLTVAPAQQESPEEYLVRFENTGVLFAVPMVQVAEISDRTPVTQVPGLPPFLPGVAHVRGEIVLAVDLTLYVRPQEASSARRSLLVKDEEGRPLAAAWIDGVVGIARYHRDEMRRPDSPTRHAFRQHELGVFEFQEQTYSVVDLLRFLRSAELKSHLVTRA